MKYRSEIDGLRAIAVLPVILFHAGLSLFSGGFVGVDIFFVISGYLITTILIEDIDKNRFSITNFYERRARRIMPAIFAVMLFCIPFAWVWMLPGQMKDFSQSILATSLFSSNILFWLKSGYFSPESELQPLLHTWTLAVEEQYYLIFPIFLFFAFKKFTKDKIFWIISLVAISSLILSEWGWRNQPSANFYLIPTRAWELLSGSLAAFIVLKKGVRSNNIFSAFGLMFIIFSIFIYDENTPFPSMYTLLPVIGAVLIIIFSDKHTITSKFLSNKLFVILGLTSYSAYLWHQPLFAFARIRLTDPSLFLMLILGLLSLLMGYLSWRFIEQPFRNKNNKFLTRKVIFISSLSGIILFSLFGYIGHKKNGFVNRFDQPRFISEGYFSFPFRWNGYCFYSFDKKNLEVGKQGVSCSIGSEDNTNPSILIFGDSYAAHWEPFFKELSKDLNFQLESVTTNYCFPTLKDQTTAPLGHKSIKQCSYNRRWLNENFQKYDIVIFAGDWSTVYKRGFSEGVYDSIIELNNTSQRTKFIILDSPPQFIKKTIEGSIYGNMKLISNINRDIQAANFWQGIVSNFRGKNNFLLLDKNDLGFYRYKDNLNSFGYTYSLDGSHISVYGAKSLYYESKNSKSFDLTKKFIIE